MTFLPQHPCLRARTRGFTLAELVIALTLFALAAAVLSQAAYNALLALSQIRTSDDTIADHAFTRRQVLRITDRELLEEGGEVTVPSGNKVRWQAQVHPTGVLDLHLLELTFERPSSSEPIPPQIEHFYLLRPSWSDPEERAAMVTQKKEEFERRQAQSGELEESDA